MIADFPFRQREEETASIGAHHMEATAQFEQDLQTLQASIDAEFGKDSDASGKNYLSPVTYQLSRSLSLSVCVHTASSVDSDNDLPASDLFCAACNKFFKTANA